MTIEQALRLIAGALVLITTALGYFVSPWFHLFTAFVGLNLFQSGLTDSCPMIWFLKLLGMKRCRLGSTIGEAG